MADQNRFLKYLADEQLIAFVGSGAARTYTNPNSGERTVGLPSASEIVESMAEDRPWLKLDESVSFPDACFAVKQEEGPNVIKSILQTHLGRTLPTPLPAYLMLGALPFAAYLTTNYDSLLENALSHAKRNPHAVIQDEDVSLLRAKHVPLIKIHGCLTRPQTIIAARDEYQPFHESKPIIEALMKAQLAQKHLLFLGFSLQDYDFNLAYESVKRALQHQMPRSYAIVAPPSAENEYQYQTQKQYWEGKGITFIEQDLTEFLKTLATKQMVRFTDEGFIWTRPSETHAIDAFIQDLVDGVGDSSRSLTDVLNKLQTSASRVLEKKRNFVALESVSNSILSNIQEHCNTMPEAHILVQKLIAQRNQVGQQIEQRGSEVVKENDQLLIFSQSVRVKQLLTGVSRVTQKTCHLYVAECRAKSPAPFQDAIEFCESLKSTFYEITIIPDCAAVHLIAENKVGKVILGAHSVFLSKARKPTQFVNTCGTLSIMIASRQQKLPVYVVAESTKLVSAPPKGARTVVSFDQEENIFPAEVASAIAELEASDLRIDTLNVGYDLCRIHNNVTVVTEKQPESCD